MGLFKGAALLAGASVVLAVPPGIKHVIDQNAYKTAACVDGTAPTFYLRKAATGSKSAQKWIVVLQGGSHCHYTPSYSHSVGGKGDCRVMRDTPFGSSKDHADTKQLEYKEILNTNPEENPVFHDWNVVFANACDGSAWLGSEVLSPPGDTKEGCPKEFLSVDGEQCLVFYNRGADNLAAVIGTSMTSGMDKATDVVLYGCGLGGYGAAHSGELVRNLLPSTSAFSTIVSGVFDRRHVSPLVIQKDSFSDDAYLVHTLENHINGNLAHAKEHSPNYVKALTDYDGSAPGTPKFRAAVAALMNRWEEVPVANRPYRKAGKRSYTDGPCVKFIMKELGYNAEAATLECWHASYGIAFNPSPVFVMNSLVDTNDFGGHHVNTSAECFSKEKCLKSLKEEIVPSRQAQIDWAISKRNELYPEVPTGAFIENCANTCFMWNELKDSNGVTNAQHVGKWLDAVSAWHQGQIKKAAITSVQKEEIKRVTRQPSEIPCESCCPARA